MTQSFKVTDLISSRPWPADGDAKVIYFDFRAEGVEQVCNIGRKPGNELRVGEVIQATAEEDRGKLKLKAVQQNNGFGGRGGRDPATEKRITRQHSQSAAIELAELAFSMGLFEKPATVRALWVDVVKPLTDTLDRDAWSAGEGQ